MEHFYIKVTPKEGEILKKASSINIKIKEQIVECEIVRLEGEKLYVEPDEQGKQIMREIASQKSEELKL